MTQTANPLRQFFRQPAIYLRLPSGGEYWPEKDLVMTPNKELPVLPMTAIDEITYRTPDALFNGQAVISVIQSCIPAIKNAWSAPSVDVNAILVAIRIASYGHNMGIGTTCPKCQNEDQYELDLRNILDQIASPDYSDPIAHGDLEIAFQPISYKNQNDTNQMQFEEQRMIRAIPGSDLPDEEKIVRLNAALKRITELTVEAMKFNIASIKTPQALVTEPEFIEEFLNNCDRNLFSKIRDRVIELRIASDLKPVAITCSGCSNEYEQSMNLDQASFFETAS
jgi:hypothetical protein